jgi:hypothetical protein
MRRAVRPWSLQRQEHATVGLQTETIVGERRAGAVAHQLFESPHAARLIGGDRDPRMQVEALDASLQRPERSFDPALARFGTQAGERRARARAEGLSPGDGPSVTRGEHGGFVRNGVGIAGRCIIEPAVPVQMTQHAAGHHGEQRVQLAVAWRGKLVERELAALGCGEYAVHDQHMGVHVQVGRGAKTLNEGDRARARGVEPAGSSPARVEALPSPYEEAEHRDHARMVVGESIAKCVRQAQHPLANRDARDDMIYAVRREIRHAFAAAARAQTPPFARQRDQPLAAADAAAKAAQAVFQHAAAKELLEGALYEAGDATVLARLLQKRGQVTLDDLIQHGLSRVSSRVGVGLGAWRGSSPRAGCARHTGCSAARAPCCDVRGVA